MINRSILIGHLTRDPELRRTQSGAAVTSFTLAINRSFESADGVQVDYIQCVCWNKIAENVEKYCSKGSMVGVEGRLQSRSYDNAQGNKVYVIELVCDNVQFLSHKKDKNELDSNMPNCEKPHTEGNNGYLSQEEIDESINQMKGETDDRSYLNQYEVKDEDIQF